MSVQKKSLEEINASVDTTQKKSGWKKVAAFIGPAYLVSVGYMDPGNWATDIAGGSKFGYSLLWVLLMSNLIALLLQSLSARLGIVRGLDLAQTSRITYPKYVNFSLYVLAEIAIAACDLAEVIGMAIGLQLLFDIPLLIGVSVSVLDTFLLLFLINYGIRKMEAFIISLVAIIGLCFLAEIFFANPNFTEVATGFIPTIPSNDALYIAIGIIGATVMPHNLYLHSSIVQTRKFNRDALSIKKAIKFNILDSTIALNFAFFVNASILILAASAFYKNNFFDIAEIQDAHKLLEPMLGTKIAPILFAIALIAAGQSSTITGTLAGQIVMEGYLSLRVQPWIRRLLTRLIAIIPAYFTILYLGEDSTGELLILSQVILSLQLGFAIIPLIHFVSNKKAMGEFAIKPIVQFVAWISALIIVSLNVNLVIDTLMGWINSSTNPIYIYLFVIPIVTYVAILLVYIVFFPLVKKQNDLKATSMHLSNSELELGTTKEFKNIAIAVDFSKSDVNAINNAIAQGGNNAKYLLVHIVESAGAIFLNNEILDNETNQDNIHILKYQSSLTNKGYNVEVELGYGNPKKAIPEIINKKGVDLLVMAAHGHKGIKDILLGTTLDAVRHKVKIPVLIV